MLFVLFQLPGMEAIQLEYNETPVAASAKVNRRSINWQVQLTETKKGTAGGGGVANGGLAGIEEVVDEEITNGSGQKLHHRATSSLSIIEEHKQALAAADGTKKESGTSSEESDVVGGNVLGGNSDSDEEIEVVAIDETSSTMSGLGIDGEVHIGSRSNSTTEQNNDDENIEENVENENEEGEGLEGVEEIVYDPVYPWRKVLTEDGDAYYWNEETDATAWDRPIFEHTIQETDDTEEANTANAVENEEEQYAEQDAEPEQYAEYNENEEQEEIYSTEQSNELNGEQEPESAEEDVEEYVEEDATEENVEHQDTQEQENNDEAEEELDYFEDKDEHPLRTRTSILQMSEEEQMSDSSSEEEYDSDDDYENRDLEWTDNLSVISPHIDFHSLEGKYSKAKESGAIAYMESTVVEIFIPPSSFKSVLLSFSRSLLF